MGTVPISSEAKEDADVVHVVFLHGMPEVPQVMEPVRVKIKENLGKYNVDLNWLYPHFPDCESVEVWASNIAAEIDMWGVDDDIVIVALSMGGKAAVHAVAHERFGLQDKVKAVITINSPLRRYCEYYNYFFGYWYPKPLLPLMSSMVFGYEKPDGFEDVLFYDSTNEANWIAKYKDCITFVSGERYPTDTLYDDSIGDRFPRVLDDGTVPVPAQHTFKTWTIYYGVKSHGSVATDTSVHGARDDIAENITKYLLGIPLTCVYPVDSGVITHANTLVSPENSWEDFIDFSSSADPCFYEVEILKGGISTKASIVNCSIETVSDSKKVLQIRSENHMPGSSMLIHWIVYGTKMVA